MQFNHTKRLRHVIMCVVGAVVAAVAGVIGVQEGRPSHVQLVEGAPTTVAPNVIPTPTSVPGRPASTPVTTARTAAVPTTTSPVAPTTAVAAGSTTTTAPKPRVTTFAMAPSSGQAGSDFTASGTGCGAGGVTVSLLPLVGSLPLDLAGAASRPDGHWSVRLAVPPLALPGRYPVFAHCTGGGLLRAFDYQAQSFIVELPG